MGRNRAFDEEQVLDSAASTFVRAGYEATSIDDLVTALGIHRGSLYNAFGSKRGLFLKTLDRYVDSLLATPDGADGTAQAQLADELVNGPTLDLLLVAAIERGQEDAEVAAAVRTALIKIEQAFAGSEADGQRPTRAIDLLGARLFARLAA